MDSHSQVNTNVRPYPHLYVHTFILKSPNKDFCLGLTTAQIIRFGKLRNVIIFTFVLRKIKDVVVVVVVVVVVGKK